jgi:hypothetical protein
MGYDKNLLVESIQNRLQNEVLFSLHFIVFIHFFFAATFMIGLLVICTGNCCILFVVGQ